MHGTVSVSQGGRRHDPPEPAHPRTQVAINPATLKPPSRPGFGPRIRTAPRICPRGRLDPSPEPSGDGVGDPVRLVFEEEVLGPFQLDDFDVAEGRAKA